MRTMMYISLALALMSFILLGCQLGNDNTIALAKTNTQQQSEVKGKSKLITKVTITKGNSKTAFEDDSSIDSFESIFSSAVKENGIVNMTNTDTYMDIIYGSGKKQHYHLWLGEEGQKSALMNTNDTHTIYTVSEDMTSKLILLLENRL